MKVTRNKIEVISDMHNFRAAFSYENACFFLADNGDIYVYDEDENYILFKESERMTLTFILLLILARKMIGGFLQQKEVTGFIYLPGR